MRGQRTLFGQYIDYEKEEQKKKYTKRGRNTEMIKNRNKAMVYRFFYYTELRRLRYDDVIHEVSQDFFLCEETVINCLTSNNSLINELYKKRPSVEELKELNERFEFDYTPSELKKYKEKAR